MAIEATHTMDPTQRKTQVRFAALAFIMFTAGNGTQRMRNDEIGCRRYTARSDRGASSQAGVVSRRGRRGPAYFSFRDLR
jgi:hypothetical protein